VKIKKKRFDNGTTRARKHTANEQWNTPSITDVYAQVQVARTMLNRINDPHLTLVKREMDILEGLLWQFATEE
jgi:hypothetical protein